MVSSADKDRDNVYKAFNQMKALSDTLSVDFKKQLDYAKTMTSKLQPKKTKRVLINGNRVTATLGQSDNVMLDFDDASEGNKFYNSLNPIPDVGSNNS